MKTGKWTEVVTGDGKAKTFVVPNKFQTHLVRVMLETDEPITMLSDRLFRTLWTADYSAGADYRSVDVELREPLPDGKKLYVVIYCPGDVQ